MSDFLEKVEESIRARRLLPRRQRILVAVSGGLDSMVLLHALAKLAPRHGWRLTVAHFNHRLRGRSSDADERLVQRCARELGLPFVSGSADVRKHAKTGGISTEMAARELRHAFLANTASRRGIRTVALAHHADDQVELFFLRLLRGASGEGLAGMKWQSASPKDAKILLVRPLLNQAKTELSHWAREQKIPFREDASNASLEFKRNLVRRELLPLLKQHYQPALEKVVLRQMEIVGAEAEFVDDAARRWLATKRGSPFARLPVALQRRCLQVQLTRKGIAPNFDLVEQLREFANRPVTITTDRQALRKSDGGVVLQPLTSDPAFIAGENRVRLYGRAGEVMLGKLRLKWAIGPVAHGIFRAPKKVVNSERFDADKVGKSVVLRHWQPGDRFQPIGMARPVKLQNLFTNQKVLRNRRHELMVGVAGGEVFWVEGLRIGERFKLDKLTVRQLKWQWDRL